MTDTSPAVVLASASPRRRELIAALVDSIEFDAADIVEQLTSDPVGDAVRLAREKASNVKDRLGPGPLVVGADTIVFDDHRSYGKPRDAVSAVAMLHGLQGRTHTVVTAVAVAADAAVHEAKVLARVTLAEMSGPAIEDYVASGRPMDKAGSYAIQDDDVPTVESLTGCYCGVMGLPLWDVRELLLAAGGTVKSPEATYARCATCPNGP